jgi:hypothetical protein
MKAGLFGGGWEDYLDALNEAFDRHVAGNAPPHPFGASIDAILTGYPDDAPDSMIARARSAPMLGTPRLGLQFPQDGQVGPHPDSAVLLEQQGVGKPAAKPSLDKLGSGPVQRENGNAGKSTINPNRAEQALSGTGYIVDGQHVGTAGLLAAANAGKPVIEGVGKALGPIGLGLDIAENAARAHAEIQAGADPRQAAAEAAGRVIARNGIVYGTEAVTGVLASLASLNPAVGVALGVAAGAGAGAAADKVGLTDWAGRTLAPIL